MAKVEDRLKNHNISLPQPAVPIANYCAAVKTGAQLFVSGQLPFIAQEEPFIGKVGTEISLQAAQKAAQFCGRNILAQAKAALGSLDRIKKVIKLTIFVAADSSFTDLARVADGVSDLFVLAFGEAGKHARSTVGVQVLPMNAPVEVEALFETENR